MDDQEGVDDDQQMMCVPESIEPCQVEERPWQFYDIPPERMGRQCEGETHQNDHENARYARNTLKEFLIIRLLVIETRSENANEFILRARCNPWKIAS